MIIWADLGGWGSAEAQQALALPQKQDMMNDVELYGKVRLQATRPYITVSVSLACSPRIEQEGSFMLQLSYIVRNIWTDSASSAK